MLGDVDNRRTVLCVEDDLTQQLILRELFKTCSPEIKVKWAETAQDAFDILSRSPKDAEGNPFDLLLTDIFLDGSVTGIDLVRICSELYPKMPVVVITGLPFDKFVEFQTSTGSLNSLFKLPGKRYYLEKPVKVTDFENLIIPGLHGSFSQATEKQGFNYAIGGYPG